MAKLRNKKKRSQEQLIAYLIWLSLLIIALLLLCAWLFDGFAASQYEFVDFYTCQDPENVERLTVYSVPVEKIYICGEIEANGVVSGSIHVYYNDDIVSRDWLSERAGHFVQEIRYNEEFRPGVYTVNFYARKRVRAQTTFTVVGAE